MDKVIFITGASTGIGAACARRFCAAGWRVALCDINDEAGVCLADELGAQAMYVHADTRDAAAVLAAVKAAVARFGRLDSVFCNAGVHRRNSMLETSEEEFDFVMKTNVYGTFHTLKAAVPAIIESGGGTVVINASDQSTVGKARSFAYGMSKGALGQITKSLSIDLQPEGVRVNAICPGTVRTPLVDGLFERIAAESGVSVESLWESENSDYARGRAGEPAEVAELVYFLASDLSSFCSGGLYLIDGGLSAG